MRLFLAGLISLVPLAISSSASAHPESPRVRYVATTPVGASVQVRWGMQWFEGQVIARRGDDYLVHYVGWSSSRDEWVDDSRLRAGPGYVAPIESSWIYWGGDWHSGRVIERRPGWLRVRYDAWGRSYGGWVEADRFRPGRRPARAERPIPVHGRPRPQNDRYDGDVYDQPVRPQPAYEPDERPVRPEPSEPDPGRPARPRPDGNDRPGQPARPQGGSPAPERPTDPTPDPQPSGGVRPTGAPNRPTGNTTPPPNQGGHATHPGGTTSTPSRDQPATRPATDAGGQATRPTR